MDQELEAKRLHALAGLNVLDTESDSDFDAITRLVSNVFNAPVSLISLVDKDRLFFKSGVGVDIKELDRKDTFCSTAITSREALIVNDASKDERFNKADLVVNEPHFRFYAGVPLITSQGFAVGTLCFTDTKVRPDLSAKELSVLTQLANITIQNLEMKAGHGDIEWHCGLQSEKVALSQLDDWIQHGTTDEISLIALEVFDSRYVSVIKASQGLKFYDALEKLIAQKIIHAQPPNSITYGLGAMRFICVVPEAIQATSDQAITEFLNAISKSIKIQGQMLTPDISMGILPVARKKTIDAQSLIREAVSSLEQARASSQRVVKFDCQQDYCIDQQFRLISELPKALYDRDQFYLEFQPIINVQSMHCTGVECLMRWKHPTQGQISPETLISWIEKLPIMQTLTQRVLALAVESFQELSAIGWDLHFAINISAFDLISDDVHEEIKKTLKVIGKERLVIEVTETAVIDDFEKIHRGMDRLKMSNIDLHIDDFGVGQSSLSYLARLPAKAIKLDQSFIIDARKNPNNVLVVKSICALAKKLNLNIVIEGVEDTKGIQLAKNFGGTFLQGYGISHPLKMPDLCDWLSITKYEPTTQCI